jgi:hypothetical protein
MPVVIKEMHVKVNVAAEDSKTSDGDCGRKSPQDRSRIINDSVERVMSVLEQKKKR